MKKTILYTLLVAIISVGSNMFSHVQAQEEDRYMSVGNLTPASPTSSALAKYAEIPISKYTGTANISVPIYTAVNEKQQLPISLSYHSNGNKVEDIASWVGLGWSLNAGGVITRIVRGLPDDAESVRWNNSFVGNAGYLHNSQFCQDLYNKHPEDYTGYELSQIRRNTSDPSPDLFIFNFDGYTGKFVFDENGDPQLFSESDLEIIHTTTDEEIDPTDVISADIGYTIPTIKGAITSFTIITPNGVRYVFDQKELTGTIAKHDDFDETTNYSDCNPPFVEPYTSSGNCENTNRVVNPAYTSWKLSKIYAPETPLNIANDDPIIETPLFEFTYENTFIYDNSQINIDNGPDCSNYHPISMGGLNNPLVLNLNKTLTSIQWANGSIDFVADLDRDDLYYHPGLQTDDEKSKGLTAIKIKNRAGNIIKRFELGYDWFNKTILNCNGQTPDWFESHRNRLKLTSVQEFGGSVSNPPYLFTYDETPMPPRHTSQKDFWGFYNGNNESSPLPALYFYPDDDVANEKYNSCLSIYPRETYIEEIYIPGADRYPNETFAKAGILTNITYPTGGASQFDYELNSFKFESFLNHGDLEYSGGGLRVKEVITYPNNPSGENIVTQYLYEDESGVASGKIIDLPSFGYLPYWILSPYQGLDGDESIRVFSSSQGGLGETKGSFVGYESVITKKDGTGKTVSKFDVPAQYGNANFDSDTYVRAFTESYHPNSSGSIPYPFQTLPSIPNPNYDWNRGQLLEEKIYDESGGLLQKIENSYQVRNFTKIVSSAHKHTVTLFDANTGNPITWKYASSKSYNISAFKYLDESILTEYSPTGNIVTTTNFTHSDNHIKPIVIEKTNGTHSTSTSILYPAEHIENSTSPLLPIVILDGIHMIHTPIETKTTGSIESGSKADFDIFTDDQGLARILPDQIFKWTRGGWQLQATFEYWSSGPAKGYPYSIQPRESTARYYFTWDNHKRLTKKEHINWQWDYTYHDENDLLESETNIDGQTLTYTYDDMLRLETISARDGAIVTNINYAIGDGDNTVVSTTVYSDGTSSQSEENHFDGLGRATTSYSNGLESENLSYDAAGRVSQKLNLPGSFITVDYLDNSPLNRRVSETYPDGTSTFMTSSNNGSAYLNRQTDENGNSTVSFTNMLGQQTKVIDALNNSTFYSYNQEGSLREVMNANGEVYEYIYDDDNRLVEKTIPGGGTQYFGYDSHDRLVASQDANLGSLGKWLITNYDEYGRSTKSGFFSGSLPTNLDNITIASSDLISQTYYDEYGNLPNTEFSTVLGGSAGCPTGSILIGKPVGTRINILDGKTPGPDWLATVNCYDEYGRVEETLSDNHLGGTDEIELDYNLADLIDMSTRTHLVNNETTTIVEEFGYDSFLRTKDSWHTVNDGPKNHISQTHYNDLGQLQYKKLGLFNGFAYPAPPSELQKIDYSYNIRGRLTHINEVNMGGDDVLIGDCTTEIPPECGPACDYEIIIPSNGGESITGIYVKGDLLMDLNYPLGSSAFVLKTEIETWLWDNNYTFGSVTVTEIGNEFSIRIIGSAIVFNKVRQQFGPILSEKYFVQSNCVGGPRPAPPTICDLCERDGYKCDKCPYWEQEEDPCTTCQYFGIEDCSYCAFVEDICTRCENLGYLDCNSCPLSVNRIKPLNIRIEYNHSALSATNPNTILARVSNESIKYLHDGTARFRSYKNMAVVGQGNIVSLGTSTYANLMEINFDTAMVIPSTFDEVVTTTEGMILEELLNAGITDQVVQNNFIDAVIEEVLPAWAGAVGTDIPNVPTGNGIDNPDLFSMELIYEGYLGGHPMVGSTPQYNGNISGVVWKTGFGSVNSYSFEYDAINRLESGLFKDDLGGGNYAIDNKYGVSLTYDAIGNIQTLSRRGVDDVCSRPQAPPIYDFTQIDNLEYVYIGSRLYTINEGSNQDKGFRGPGGSYGYDGNGNIVLDQNKQLNASYNHLNLPYGIGISSNSINFTYDASGTKLQKHSQGQEDGQAVNTTKDYVGGIEYKDGVIEAIYHGEGRVLLKRDDQSGSVRFQSEYNLKDHLGNVRVVFSDLNENGYLEPFAFNPQFPFPGDPINYQPSEMLQENHYYPFGMEMEGAWELSVSSPENKYLFNGIEHASDFGLDWDMAVHRSYDPAIGRWLQVDPFADVAPNWTPYRFGFNNPIRYSDLLGLFESEECALGGHCNGSDQEDWIDNGDGTWTAEKGDGAETLAQDAGIEKDKAYDLMDAQGHGTYTDPDDGVLKSAVDPGEIVKVSGEEVGAEVATGEGTVLKPSVETNGEQGNATEPIGMPPEKVMGAIKFIGAIWENFPGNNTEQWGNYKSNLEKGGYNKHGGAAGTFARDAKLSGGGL